MSQGPAESADLGALADLAPELASTFVSVASDIALVIDPDGVIRSVAQGDAPIFREASRWVGQRFVDTVSDDTRSKILQLLQDVDSKGVSRRREVNLAGHEGGEIPMAFAAIRLGQTGPVLAVGRDLRAIAAIQQRFVEAQQELERDYWRQRQAEARYRLLFQVATDAVLVVDGHTLHIIEANAAAHALQPTAGALAAQELAGRSVTVVVDPASRPAVEELLVTARATGKPAEIRARLLASEAGGAPPLVDISATPFRAGSGDGPQLLLLVRARRHEGAGNDGVRRLADYVEHTPDAVAITDSTGRVQLVNPAFLLLCPAGATEASIKGRALAEVLGDPARRIAALVAEVRRNGIVSHATSPIGSAGRAGRSGVQVEVSAALLEEGDQACLGFTLRRLAFSRDVALPQVDGLASAIEMLALQLGRVSLPELMQEATHVAERHLIRAALSRANGNLMLAADWLGITADSLVLRMHRHNLAALAADAAPPPLLN